MLSSTTEIGPPVSGTELDLTKNEMAGNQEPPSHLLSALKAKGDHIEDGVALLNRMAANPSSMPNPRNGMLASPQLTERNR